MASPPTENSEGPAAAGREAPASGPGQEEERPAPSAQPEPGAAERPSEERPAEGREPLQPLDVYTVLRVSIAQLAAVAWQKLGLQADPFTNTTSRDIAQARIAIDATAALAEKLLPHLRGQEARDYQNLLTDLRLNFVKQSERGQETT